MTQLANVVGATAFIFTAVSILPQLRRLIRTQDVSGVSPSWTLMGCVTTGAWTLYGLVEALAWVAVADGVAFASYLAVTAALGQSRTDRFPPQSLLIGSAWLAVFVAAAVVGGVTTVGTLLGVSFAVQVTPSIWVAYRTAQPTGISLATWALIGAEGGLWGTYGLLVEDVAVQLFGSVAVASSALMLLRLWWTSASGRHSQAIEPSVSGPNVNAGLAQPLEAGSEAPSGGAGGDE